MSRPSTGGLSLEAPTWRCSTLTTTLASKRYRGRAARLIPTTPVDATRRSSPPATRATRRLA
eukprot:3384987-Pyramimonas_sp.AAC.1